MQADVNGMLRWGETHHDTSRSMVGHRMQISICPEDLPEAHNRVALDPVRALAGGPFAALDATRRAEVAAKLRAEGGSPVRVLTRTILLCYYRDDRVMVSLGPEARPPFPKGHMVGQGDWSLVDPVRARKPFLRPVS